MNAIDLAIFAQVGRENACPSCGAKPGCRCVTRAGRVLETTHRARPSYGLTTIYASGQCHHINSRRLGEAKGISCT
jgi:pyruvate/2-oxoacid:ferredoxin oxidoreductase beta subunit